jgi:hypothetical protein
MDPLSKFLFLREDTLLNIIRVIKHYGTASARLLSVTEEIKMRANNVSSLDTFLSHFVL